MRPLFFDLTCTLIIMLVEIFARPGHRSFLTIYVAKNQQTCTYRVLATLYCLHRLCRTRNIPLRLSLTMSRLKASLVLKAIS